MSDICQLTIVRLQHLDSNVTFMRAVMLVCAVCQCDLRKKRGRQNEEPATANHVQRDAQTIRSFSCLSLSKATQYPKADISVLSFTQ